MNLFSQRLRLPESHTAVLNTSFPHFTPTSPFQPHPPPLAKSIPRPTPGKARVYSCRFQPLAEVQVTGQFPPVLYHPPVREHIDSFGETKREYF